MENQVLESPVLDLEKINISQLPELQGLREKQLQIVAENPFIQIIDNKTFEEAKKARTTLVSARTEIQNQDKLIASKIKKFRDSTISVTAELIAITKPHEEKQQEEVKRFEAEKEAEKMEKQRIEDERISKIKTEIDKIYNSANAKIQNLTFDLIQTLEVDFEQNLFKTDTAQFEEFELDFNEKLMQLKVNLSSKKSALQEKEEQRLEAEQLKSDREKLEADRKELEAKQKLADEKAEADRKKIADEQKSVQDKLDDDRKSLEAEKAAIEKAEADKKAKELADAVAIEKAENDRIATEKAELEAKVKAEKQEALKPEKEKAIDFLNCLVFKNDLPEIKDADLLNHVETFINEIEQQRNDLIKFINIL